MDKKYFAQILLEVELDEINKNFADVRSALIASYIAETCLNFGPTKILNTHIIAEPSDEEFLDRFGEDSREGLYTAWEMLD